MKKILLFAALILGSLMAPAHSASTLRDVTAAIDDSIRIMPNFALGDTRTYRVTTKTDFEYRHDLTSMDYHLTVESVDPDYYGLYLVINNFNYNDSTFPGATQLLNFFATEGIRFYYNRHSLKVDSVESSRLTKPLMGFLTEIDKELNNIFNMDSVQQFIENEFHTGINDIAAELLKEMMQPWTDQYGSTYALGESQWIESFEDDDPMAMDADTVEDVVDSGEQLGIERVAVEDDVLVVDDSEELPDYSVQMEHQAFARKSDNGSLYYRETITWASPLFVDNWCEEREASFDAKGWPAEISSTMTMGEYSLSVHWQLMNHD